MADLRSVRRRRVFQVALGVAVLLFVAVAQDVLRAPQLAHPVTWKEPHSGMEFVLVRAGAFTMGTPDHEMDREPGETPHVVRLTRPFYLGRYEVTQEEWARVMGEHPSHFQGCGPRCPVERVTWFNAQEFIRRLNARGRTGFRLPTEAEWEYACRAGRSEAFGRHASLSSRDANIHGEYPYNAPKGVFRKRPVGVGYFPANPWGLFDMSGNVWEWVQDWHCPYPEEAVADPVGDCATKHRVIRGGSWLFNGASARCGLRYTHQPEHSGYSLGLRLAHDVN